MVKDGEVLASAELTDHATNRSVTGHVGHRDKAVKEPVNGDNKAEAVRNTRGAKRRVVGCNDQHQPRRGYRSSTSTANRRNNDQKAVTGTPFKTASQTLAHRK